MWAWVVVLVLEVVYWELFVQFWGGQPSAALHGIVAVLSAVSPACLQGQSVGRLRGSSGASQWVAVQKVILGAHNQVQCFALAPVLIPASDQAWRKSTSSVPYSALLASLYFRKISGLDLNFLMCRVLIIISVSLSDCYLSLEMNSAFSSCLKFLVLCGPMPLSELGEAVPCSVILCPVVLLSCN